jgi:hypothetical protein
MHIWRYWNWAAASAARARLFSARTYGKHIQTPFFCVSRLHIKVGVQPSLLPPGTSLASNFGMTRRSMSPLCPDSLPFPILRRDSSATRKEQGPLSRLDIADVDTMFSFVQTMRYLRRSITKERSTW